MFVYSAGSQSVKRTVQMADESGQNNLLFTFADKQAQQCARHFCAQPQRNLIIDSGAYSAWSREEEIDLDEYIRFCGEILAIKKCNVEFISLDVSLGSKEDGFVPDEYKVEEACEKGWSNYTKLRAVRIPVMPVFHQFEDFDWLHRMAKDTKYISVSPRKRVVSQDLKIEWLGKVFSEVGLDVKIHGLGISSSETLESFPFYSVDSSTWLESSKGTFRYFDGRQAVCLSSDEWRTTSEEHRWDDGTDAVAEARETYVPQGQGGNYHFMKRALEADVRLQRFLSALWDERGIRSGTTSPDEISDEANYHLSLSADIYKEAKAAGGWRAVAARRGLGPSYVQWAINLATH